MILLELGGVAISVEETDSISQTYELIGGAASLRTLGGGLIRQRNWRKLKTVVSVSEARFLPALQALDLDTTQVLKCVAPREIASAVSAITLPTARRADAAPYGFAMLATGFRVRTPGVLVGDVMTLQAVPGAVRYSVCYVPQLVVIAMLTERFDVRGAVAGWELTAEEV